MHGFTVQCPPRSNTLKPLSSSLHSLQSAATIKANNSHIVLNASANGAPLGTTLSALDLALYEVRPAPVHVMIDTCTVMSHSNTFCYRVHKVIM